jgi:hypothetical protein
MSNFAERFKQEANRISTSTSPNKKRGKNIFDFIWRPTSGSTTIRIVPNKKDPEWPFYMVYIHGRDYTTKIGLANYEFVSPKTFQKEDPAELFANNLYRQDYENNKQFIKYFSPQKFYYIPILIRGKESSGIKVWPVNTKTYEKIFNIISTIYEDEGEESSKIFDLKRGTDLVITKPSTGGVEITAKRSPSNILERAEEGYTIEDFKRQYEELGNIEELYITHTKEEIEKMVTSLAGSLFAKSKAPESNEIVRGGGVTKSVEEPSKKPLDKPEATKSLEDDFSKFLDSI